MAETGGWSRGLEGIWKDYRGWEGINSFKELKEVHEILKNNGYDWRLVQGFSKYNTTNNKRELIGRCVLPYYPDLSERIAKIMWSARIGVAHKPLRTILGVLIKLKDEIPDSDKSGVVYSTGCKDCG